MERSSFRTVCLGTFQKTVRKELLSALFLKTVRKVLLGSSVRKVFWILQKLAKIVRKRPLSARKIVRKDVLSTHELWKNFFDLLIENLFKTDWKPWFYVIIIILKIIHIIFHFWFILNFPFICLKVRAFCFVLFYFLCSILYPFLGLFM